MAENTCAIVIPVYNRPAMTRTCLESIYRKTRTPFNLIVVDNASSRETKEMLGQYRASRDNFTIIENAQNLGWVKAVNQGLRSSSAPYVCVMNNDTVVRTDDWLSALIDVARSHPDIGLVNPTFEIKEQTGSSGPFIEIDFCRGYSILIKRAVIERIGYLDESYGLGYYDDDDYSVRAVRAGFRCVRANGVFVENLRDSTFTDLFRDDKRMELHEANKALFYRKWGRRLRLAFVVARAVDRNALSENLFYLARRQHIIYLWNRNEPLGLRHINIRERPFPGYFSGILLSLELLLNSRKKDSKRYDAVFVDGMKRLPMAADGRVHYVDLEKEASSVNDIVESLARA